MISVVILILLCLPNQTQQQLLTKQRTTMTDTLPDAGGVQEEVKTMDNDKNDDMFVSAMSDSPTDSGLETNKTSNSDTMEDLSLQVRMNASYFELFL